MARVRLVNVSLGWELVIDEEKSVCAQTHAVNCVRHVLAGDLKVGDSVCLWNKPPYGSAVEIESIEQVVE